MNEEERRRERRELFREAEQGRVDREEPIVLSIYTGDLDGYKIEQVETYIRDEIRMALERLELPDKPIIKSGLPIGIWSQEGKK